MVVKVVVLDDDPIFMELIKTVLALEPIIAVVGDAATMEEGIAVALRECPDVILVDYRLPDGTGTMAAQFIRLHNPLTRVVVMSSSPWDAKAAAVAIGARFLDKSWMRGGILIDALIQAAVGSGWQSGASLKNTERQP
jgi:DNA-binding NarL/FixJ family response regulator